MDSNSSRLKAARVALGALGITALSAACYPKAGAPAGPLSPASVEAASARWPGATASSLEGGRALFLAKCNSCHHYPDLTAISENEWPSIMDKMGKKAHLDPDQTQSVLHFVLASRKEQGGT